MGMQHFTSPLSDSDPEIWAAISDENVRQQDGLELIASENYVSRAVLQAAGSILTNKYAEGYPGKRYYGGMEHVDEIERLAIARCLELFGAEHANVQPHSGSSANEAALSAVLQPGDTVLSLEFSHGGHLTHGHPLSFSGKRYRIVHYGVDPETETIDYDRMIAIALEEKPKLILCGASAYPRTLAFDRIRKIADECGALMMADIAHIAGLVAAGLHPSPFPHADIVTTTTHKTLRGPRGGIIMCKKELASAVDRAVFPGAQGGPLMHVIAGKAAAFREALQPSFREYQQRVIDAAAAMASTLQEDGFRIVSGGTDTHLFLMDLRENGLTGAAAERVLGEAGITVNKNLIPFDPNPPMKPSGIRIGTPAIVSRGLGVAEAKQVASLIARALRGHEDPHEIELVAAEVRALTRRFPIYEKPVG